MGESRLKNGHRDVIESDEKNYNTDSNDSYFSTSNKGSDQVRFIHPFLIHVSNIKKYYLNKENILATYQRLFGL